MNLLKTLVIIAFGTVSGTAQNDGFDAVDSPNVRVMRHDDGSWTKFFPLGPGRYEYKLIVDGRWVVDPLNPLRVANDSGSENSVLEIEA